MGSKRKNPVDKSSKVPSSVSPEMPSDVSAKAIIDPDTGQPLPPVRKTQRMSWGRMKLYFMNDEDKE